MDILILTFDLDIKENCKIKPQKYLPRVCREFRGKTMIEIAIENSLRLNPDRIILYVYKNNIEYINKIVRRKPYSKILSYCMLGSLNKIKYKNLLVIPGNAPLLTIRTMNRIIGQNRNIKINNNLFYLKEGKIKDIFEMEVSKEFLISQIEINKVENEEELKKLI